MASKQVLLINLGSPDGPDRRSVARYLKQFLTDPYVIDLPWLPRQILVRAIIAPFRSAKSAHAYQSIWTKEGSPLVNTTRQFAEALQLEVGESIKVHWAMRYGEPSIASVMKKISGADGDLLVVPLYPQYAESSSKTALEEVTRHAPKGLVRREIADFYQADEFILAQTAVIREGLKDFKADHLLLSYHGLPVHHLTKMYPDHCTKDRSCCEVITAKNRYCYRAQCVATTRAIKSHLPLRPDQVSMAFQSRLGRRPWIQPYTDQWVDELLRQGVRRLAVACPSFVADCLETLEEVGMRLREDFRARGGEDLKLLPALNVHPEWVKSFAKMIDRLDAR